MKKAFIILVMPALALVLALNPPIAAAQSGPRAWVQMDETVVPIRENTTRNAVISGFARKGQVVAVERIAENWVKVRVNDTLAGWVPSASVSESGPPVELNPGYVKGVVLALAALGLGVFLFLAGSLQLKRYRESRERTLQAQADAKRRLQNKIQLLFHSEPRIRSHLAKGEADLRDFLLNIGYVANLENEKERFVASCKTFKPNLIMAGFEFHDAVEKLMEMDAMLINTPVIYLHCGGAPAGFDDRVRAYLESNASEKELAEAIAQCLKKSPEKIRFSVKPVALKGEIQAGTLMELLHFLAAVKKSGRLLAASGASQGEVRIREGDIVLASVDGLAGAPAAEAILDLVSGSFEFHEQVEERAEASGSAAEAVKSEAEGILNTQKILMDWAKKQDESNHHSGA